MTVNSDSTHQKWMKFAFNVTCSIFLQSYWVSDNVIYFWTFMRWKINNLIVVSQPISTLSINWYSWPYYCKKRQFWQYPNSELSYHRAKKISSQVLTLQKYSKQFCFLWKIRNKEILTQFVSAIFQDFFQAFCLM